MEARASKKIRRSKILSTLTMTVYTVFRYEKESFEENMTKFTTLLKIFILLGSFVFDLPQAQEIPLNDQCQNATGPLTIDGEMISSSTIGGTTVPRFIEIKQCQGQTFDVNTPGVWFEVIGTGVKLRASTCAEETNFENRVTVYGGADCDDSSCIDTGTTPQPGCPYSNSSYTEWYSVPGKRYFVFVHDRDQDSSGNFGLTITDVSDSPENDECENAIELEAGSTMQGTTVGASEFYGVNSDGCIEGGHEHPGVWYRIPTHSMDTQVTVATCGPLLTYHVSVYHGDVCGGEFYCQESVPKADVGCDDGFAFQTKFNASSAREYYFYVHAAEIQNGIDAGAFGIQFVRSDEESDSGASVAKKGYSLYLLYLSLLSNVFLAL